MREFRQQLGLDTLSIRPDLEQRRKGEPGRGCVGGVRWWGWNVCDRIRQISPICFLLHNAARYTPRQTSSRMSSPPKPPPCKETICSTKKDALKSMLAAQSSKPGPSTPAAPCPPDREELGRHTWTLVRAPFPLTLIATRWATPPFCSSDAHARCLLPREAHHSRARGSHLLLARAGWALPVRPLR